MAEVGWVPGVGLVVGGGQRIEGLGTNKLTAVAEASSSKSSSGGGSSRGSSGGQPQPPGPVPPDPTGMGGKARWNGNNWQWEYPPGTDFSGLTGGATTVPAGNVANPVITPVTATTPGASPIATGVELFLAMLAQVMSAETLRQNAINQTIDVAKLATEFERVSPTRAADFATALGIPGLEPDLSFANRFVNDDTTGSFGGRVGTQDLQLPWAFNGKELSFLNANQNVGSILDDISARLGRPDLLKNSMQSLIPTNGSLFKF